MLPSVRDKEKIAVTLLVENGDLLNKYATLLRDAGLRFQLSQTVEEGLALLKHFATTICLLDMPLPIQECVEVVRKLREVRSEIYVMLVTEQTDPVLLECLFTSGVDYTLPRPVPWEKVIPSINTALNTAPTRSRRPPPQSKEGVLVDKQSKLMRTKQAAALEALLLKCKQHSPPLFDHMQRVQHYAKALAADLGLEKTQQFEVALAARLHDIGKIDVPASVLEKTTDLTPEEMESMRSHPQKGEELVKAIVNYPRVLAAIRGHHERMDGKGYPDGLSGRAIALETRVVSIADCFDALVALAPPGQKPLQIPQALEVLRGQGQGHLDAALVEEFVRLLRRRRELVLQGTGKAVPATPAAAFESELVLLERRLSVHLDRY
jgi:response regulator RpfG family c-di-GMP phosphodiesterase